MQGETDASSQTAVTDSQLASLQLVLPAVINIPAVTTACQLDVRITAKAVDGTKQSGSVTIYK